LQAVPFEARAFPIINMPGLRSELARGILDVNGDLPKTLIENANDMPTAMPNLLDTTNV